MCAVSMYDSMLGTIYKHQLHWYCMPLEVSFLYAPDGLREAKNQQELFAFDTVQVVQPACPL